MHLFPLLGLALKSDEVIEVLEHYDVKVVYDFDRLHENTAVVYWASFYKAGFDLRFDEKQVLDTIFMYVLPNKRYKPIDSRCAGVSFYRSFSEARAAFEANRIPFSNETNGQGWIKGEYEKHSVHYEFNECGTLRLVTVMAAVA